MDPDNRQGGMKVWQQAILGCVLLLVITCAMAALTLFMPCPAHRASPSPAVHLEIFAINDFHGQLPPGQTMNKRPVGGAPVLDSYLDAAMASDTPDATIFALPGDVIGVSPPESGLLLDEPATLYFNSYANSFCSARNMADEASCNMVATPGNHEFDNGIPELMRIIYGGNGSTSITHLVDPYPGTKSVYVNANVAWKANGTLLFPPYTIQNVDGVPVAFTGAVTTSTPAIVKASAVEDVVFMDEAESVNRYIPEIRQKGVHAIVVLLHEGGNQPAYDGTTRENTTVTGRVAEIVPRLDGDVDVVLSGHTHAFTNAYLKNAAGNPVLVTQAYMYSRGYADIDLYIDRATGEIVKKTAEIVPTYADEGPGMTPDPAVSAFLAADEKVIAPQVDRLIGVASVAITRGQDSAGESALADMVADGQRAAMKTDTAFVTTGGVRADIAAGNITWGDLYAVQPFASTVQSATFTGRQIRQALERQWQEPLPPHNLAVSGLSYGFDATKPAGSRIAWVKVGGKPLDESATYTAAMVDFLAGGGDNYTVFTEGTGIEGGPRDIDALVAYTGSLPQPVNVTTDGRIEKTG